MKARSELIQLIPFYSLYFGQVLFISVFVMLYSNKMMKPINWFYTSEKDVNLLKPVLYQISNKHAEFLTTQKGI